MGQIGEDTPQDLTPDRGLSAAKSSRLTGLCAVLGVAVWTLSLFIGASQLTGLVFSLGSLILGVGLLSLIWFDLHAFRLPNLITYGLIGAGLILTFQATPGRIGFHLSAAVLGYGLIWFLARVTTFMRGTAGIGLGDAKLLAAAGAWFGLLNFPIVLLISSGLGIVSALVMSLVRRSAADWRKQRLPFGPFISLAMWLTWCFDRLIGF